MFRIIDTFNTLPLNYPIDKKLNCLPGQIAALAIKDKQPTIIISDGVAPFGIIDDIRSDKARCVSIDEKFYISVSNINGKYLMMVTPQIKQKLFII